MSDARRRLPGVDVLLASPAFQDLLRRYPRGRVVDAARETLALIREEVARAGDGALPEGHEDYACRIRDLLDTWDLPSLRPVINATGVVLHTNLGRAPLSDAARQAMARVGRGYSNLEFDLESGERGSRYVHCVRLLKELTGANDALVVNNNAAAVVLALNTLALGRGVLVSRGELVEIGGGFRIPDMLSRSGAVLREVGTTNRTRLEDYREAAVGGVDGPAQGLVAEAAPSVGGVAGTGAAAILKVHRSNFRISGFTEEAGLADLAVLALELGLFLVHDLGSGLLADPARLGLPHEPRAPESLKAGVHAVAISGDKLLGGPQAGIILGKGSVVEAMRRNPLCRAFRVDKVTLAGLEATLRHYLDPEEALREIPVLRQLAAPQEELEARARALAAMAAGGGVEVVATPGLGVVGGGTCPGVDLPGWTLRVKVAGMSSRELAHSLRARTPSVVGRVIDDEVVLDVRTVDPGEDQVVAEALQGYRHASR